MAWALVLQANANAVGLRTVALTDQQAVGAATGVTFESFGSIYQGYFIYHAPVLNDWGQVAFRGNIAGSDVNSTNNQGVWSEGSGSLALVIRTGSQAPGAAAGVNFRIDPQLELYSPVLNNAGKTAFYASTTDGRLGLWSEGSGALGAVARTGDHAPGTPSGVNIQFNSLYEYLETPILNDAGKVSFRSYLSGSGVNSSNRIGLWTDASGSLELVARLGSQATGLPAGVRYGVTADVGLNDAGQYVFFSFLTGSGVNSTNERSLWSNASGSLSMVVRTGTQAPGLPSGVNISGLSNVLSINDAGKIIFVSSLSSEASQYGQDAVWVYDAGNMSLVARRGEHPPSTPDGVTWNLLGVPAMNNAGRILFGSQLAGPGVDLTNELAVFFSDISGNKSLIFREGDQAPGTPTGTFFAGILEDSVARGGINDAGQGLFCLNLAGAGVDSSNDTGLWATDDHDVLQLIAREGDQLEVAPGDVRTISQLNPSGIPGNVYGWPSSFNNVGQVAFWASFTDGTQGVFVSNAVAHIPGDFNGDGRVDRDDLTEWKGDIGLNGDSDADGDGDSDGADFLVWQRNLSRSLDAPGIVTVPEPATSMLVIVAAVGICRIGRRMRQKLVSA